MVQVVLDSEPQTSGAPIYLNRSLTASPLRGVVAQSRKGRNVKTRTLITLLACYALNAHALPIVFSGTQFETSAAAIAGSQADAEFDSSPPSTLPLVTSATVVGTSDFASGNAIAASGLLTASAEASSVAGVASGVGTAEFVGTFAGGGLLGITLNFNTQNFTDSTGFSAGTLFVHLISNNVTLLNEIVS